MLEYALGLDGPAMIRYPKVACPAEDGAFALPLEKGRGVWLRQASPGGGKICLAFTGSLYLQALDAARRLKAAGHEADLYNLRFLKPVDEGYLIEQLNNYDLVVFIEEGVRCGGFGEYAVALAGWEAKTATLAVEEDFSVNGRAIGTGDELLRENKLDGAGIAERILGMIK